MCKHGNTVMVPLCKPRENSKLKYAKVDMCIAPLVAHLNLIGIQTMGACCGHGDYPPSIILKVKGKTYDYFSNEVILRKRRFYVTDKRGYYYIPETIKEAKR